MAFNMLNLISFCSKSGMDEGGSWGLESFQAEPCLLGELGTCSCPGAALGVG
jgi:hypothetical protein